MATYKMVDASLNLPAKKSFKIMPIRAIPHATPKIVQPVFSGRTTSVKGV